MREYIESAGRKRTLVEENICDRKTLETQDVRFELWRTKKKLKESKMFGYEPFGP
jgi:hypothetical protein